MDAEQDTTDETQHWLVVISVPSEGSTAREAAEAAWDGLTHDGPPVVTVHRADGDGVPVTVDLLCDDAEPDGGEYENQIIDTVRAGLAEDHEDGTPEPVGVVFRSYDHTVAWYVDDTGTVLFADGTTDERNFGPRMAELMTMRFGRTGPNFVVIVNLTNADVDGDEHGKDADIHHLLGVTRPAVSTPTNDNA